MLNNFKIVYGYYKDGFLNAQLSRWFTYFILLNSHVSASRHGPIHGPVCCMRKAVKRRSGLSIFQQWVSCFAFMMQCIYNIYMPCVSSFPHPGLYEDAIGDDVIDLDDVETGAFPPLPLQSCALILGSSNLAGGYNMGLGVCMGLGK